MKPAPPVMHTRLRFRGTRDSSRGPPRQRIAPQWKQFVGWDAVAHERGDVIARSVERGDDQQIEGNLPVLRDWSHRHAEEELATLNPVEDRDRIEPEFLQRQMRE